jgi:hypothetical protein
VITQTTLTKTASSCIPLALSQLSHSAPKMAWDV